MSKEKIKSRWLFFGKDKYTYDTIDELVNKSMGLAVGEVVTLNGYYSADDGATHKRVIADTDDGSGIQLRSGKWANLNIEIVNKGHIDVRWLGAKSDFDFITTGGTDSSEYFLQAIDISNKYNIPIMVIGNFIIGKSITTKGDLNIQGVSKPNRELIANTTSYKKNFNPASSIFVKAGLTAFTLEGVGQSEYGEDNITTTNINISNVVLIGGGQYGTVFLKCIANGAPSRPGVIKSVEAYNFDKVFEFSYTGNPKHLGTNYYNLSIEQGCYFYSNKYTIYSFGKDNTFFPSLGGFSFKDNVSEQGGRFYLRNIFGFNEIHNCLLEGQDNVIDTLIHNGILSITGNYFEVNTGIINIDSEKFSNKLNFYNNYNIESKDLIFKLRNIDLYTDSNFMFMNAGSSYEKVRFNTGNIRCSELIAVNQCREYCIFNDFNFYTKGKTTLSNVFPNTNLTPRKILNNNIVVAKVPENLEIVGNFSQHQIQSGTYIFICFFKTQGKLKLELHTTGNNPIAKKMDIDERSGCVMCFIQAPYQLNSYAIKMASEEDVYVSYITCENLISDVEAYNKVSEYLNISKGEI